MEPGSLCFFLGVGDITNAAILLAKLFEIELLWADHVAQLAEYLPIVGCLRPGFVLHETGCGCTLGSPVQVGQSPSSYGQSRLKTLSQKNDRSCRDKSVGECLLYMH